MQYEGKKIWFLFDRRKRMIKVIRPALVLLVALTIITGVLYPLLITGIAQGLFPNQANGNLLSINGSLVGSRLIGQSFDQPQYFWGRLSSTSDVPYNASSSGGSNYGVLNPSLEEQVQARIDALISADPGNTLPIPVDLVTASASGLDPDISVAAAQYQAARIARLRNLDITQVMQLIAQNTHDRWLGIIGEPVVNVLELNLALDALQ
jgi:potassium-transporting ATPase KdpC subunit